VPHLLSDIAQLWVFWLAAAGIVLAVVTMVWHSREASRRFDGWCETLHVHPDLIHSHTDGDHAHVHTETGERVPVRG
jgi:hypothetical protein